MSAAVDASQHIGIAGAVVSRMARHWQQSDRDDLLQHLLCELMRCAGAFDPELGNQFSTYATRCLELQARTFRRLKRTFRNPPGRYLILFGNMRWASGDLNRGGGIDTEESELMAREDHSFEVVDAKEDERVLTADLKTRARDVLLRHLAGETLEEIGERYGVTKERIRQIEEAAIEKLKQRLAV